jgi:hypothetical protein
VAGTRRIIRALATTRDPVTTRDTAITKDPATAMDPEKIKGHRMTGTHGNDRD